MTNTGRYYTVWVKGQRISTETTMSASSKLSALIIFANRRGLKSYQCDGLLIRKTTTENDHV